MSNHERCRSSEVKHKISEIFIIDTTMYTWYFKPSDEPKAVLFSRS